MSAIICGRSRRMVKFLELPGWRWIHTPGHTAGHISLFRESDHALIVGDAFCTANQASFLDVARQTPELTEPPPYYTPDWDRARDTVREFAALHPLVIAPDTDFRCKAKMSRAVWNCWRRTSIGSRVRRNTGERGDSVKME